MSAWLCGAAAWAANTEVHTPAPPDPRELELAAKLTRKGIDLVARENVATELSKVRHSSRAAELVDALQRVDKQPPSHVAEDLAKLLLMVPVRDLEKVRVPISHLAAGGEQAAVRRAGWAAMVVTAGRPGPTWAISSPRDRVSLAEATLLIRDAALREKFQPLLLEAVESDETPADLREAAIMALPRLAQVNHRTYFLLLSKCLREGHSRFAAARALRMLPRESWEVAEVEPILTAMVAWAQTVTPELRQGQGYAEVLQAGLELATLLPKEKGGPRCQQIRELQGGVFVIKTVREQLRYDVTQLVVKPGQAIQVIFENADEMSHNLMFVRPGVREQLVAEALRRALSKVGSPRRAFVPRRHPGILATTALLEPGQKETLRFTVPAEEQVCEFTCTVPGRGAVMRGQLVITNNPEAAEVHQHEESGRFRRTMVRPLEEDEQDR